MLKNKREENENAINIAVRMPRPPNILWIVTTQWRAQACGYAGDPNACTPHLDALAAESINYTQAVTPHPFGPFARAALLTGVPSPQNGVRDYFDPLPAGARTIAHALAECGYTTAFFGKWHLASRDPRAPLVGESHAKMIVPPENRGGFHLWEGFESGFLLNDPWLHGTRLPQPQRMAGYQSDVVCDRAGAWTAAVDRGAGANRKPWFCVVSLEPPHPPYDAPAADVSPKDPMMLSLAANVPRGGEAEIKARRELAGYYAHIEATDRALGRLIAAQSRERVVVVFTSVHGDMHGAHGLFRKGWPHEESVRVPLLVRLPRHEGGEEFSGPTDELVTLLDLPRWALDWASGGMRSRPAALSGPGVVAAQGISMPSVVALPQQCDRVWRGLRTRTRKLVWSESAATEGAASVETPWLFFDLERDPDELINLANAPERQAEITALRRSWS